jgi:hypothetical protein
MAKDDIRHGKVFEGESPYTRFNWEHLSSDLTPMLILGIRSDFNRGADVFEFPANENRIYISNAEFSVLNEEGFSTATVTLVDPDFYQLEKIFMKALFYANTNAKDGNYWYMWAMWGWSFYGAPLKNPGETDTESAQYKLSGKHYYMLKDLNYNIEKTELSVTINLVDIGRQILGAGTENESKKVVGDVSVPKTRAERVREYGGYDPSSGGYVDPEKLEEASRTDSSEDLTKEERLDKLEQQMEEMEEGPDGGSGTGSAGEQGSGTNRVNVFKDMTNWEIIKAILAAQDPPVEAVASGMRGINDKEEADEKDNIGLPAIPPEEPQEERRIPASKGLRETIEELLSEIPSIPSQEEIERMKNEGKEVLPATRHWDVLAGGWTKHDTDRSQRMVFGWVPDPPSKDQAINIDKSYRLAREYVYRPGYLGEVLSGKTMIRELDYTWTSEGYWGLGLPNIYGIAEDKNGNPIVIETKEDWATKGNQAERFLVGSKPTTWTYDPLRSRPVEEGTDDTIPLKDAASQTGLKIDFNFDTNVDSKEKITTRGKNIIINVWNFLQRELLEVSITIPGDPFLDNRVLSRGATTEKEDDLGDLLVDLYNSYFLINVYTQDEDGSRENSKIFQGKYLCLKGCTHSIDENEYTTTLQLLKAF